MYAANGKHVERESKSVVNIYINFVYDAVHLHSNIQTSDTTLVLAPRCSHRVYTPYTHQPHIYTDGSPD